jgi:hypothetical protein
VFLSFSIVRKAEQALFMPKTYYCRYPSRWKKYFVIKFIEIFSPKCLISEIPLQEVTGHFWESNFKAAEQLSSLKEKLKDEESVFLLNRILDDHTVVNYFQGSLVYDIGYGYLLKSVIKDYEHKDINLISIDDQSYGKNNHKGVNLIRLFLMLKHYIFCCFIPLYFSLKTLMNGFRFNPKPIEINLSMPVISGINKQESGHVSAAKGVKFSNDDSFIYGNKIKHGEVIHIFNFWEFTNENKQSFIENMEEIDIKYLDTKKLKIDLKTLMNASQIAFMVIAHPVRFFRNYNQWYVERMNSFLPKALMHILQKYSELSYVKPNVELIRNDYNPASILRAIISKQNNIKTVGIQHTATPYDCPQLCFINYDRYLLFGDLYKKHFKDFLSDTKVIINGKDFLDPVIDLKNNQEQQKKIQSDFKKIYGDTENIIMIIFPGNHPMIRKNMRIKMVNAVRKWIENKNRKNSERILLRFRKKIEIKSVEEWRQLYELSQSEDKIIVDFDNFTTQELMYLSDRIIIPHSSYSMTEAMALDKEAFSFDYSGSAFFYFGAYGKGLVIEKEEDLYQTFMMDNKSLSENINYKMLSSDLDAFYDGKNIERLQDLIIEMSS